MAESCQSGVRQRRDLDRSRSPSVHGPGCVCTALYKTPKLFGSKRPFRDYGRMFQNGVFAIARAFLLSAEVPGVNCPLSPAELNEAACC